MKQIRISQSPPKKGQREKDNKIDYKSRASNYDRFARPSKCLPKIAVDYYELRKPLNIYMDEELRMLNRSTYFQRVYILAKNIDDKKVQDYWFNSNFGVPESETPNFCEYIHHHVNKILAICEKKKSSSDHMSGLFIAIGGHYTLLMIEGPEDMMLNFFEEFKEVHDTIWVVSRVFLVEDKIGEIYFDKFYSRSGPEININENFPPSTPHDFNLMAVQHLKIKENIKRLVETLSNQIKLIGKRDTTVTLNSNPISLPADPFNRLLPEIQRIDLVLNAYKFYRTVKDFSATYRVVETHLDEDDLFWPIQNNYTPLQIFERSPFDVNLTFGSYSGEEKKENKENSSQHSKEFEEQ